MKIPTAEREEKGAKGRLRGAGMSQITWPCKPGKEFVFYSKIRCVMFDLRKQKGIMI